MTEILPKLSSWIKIGLCVHVKFKVHGTYAVDKSMSETTIKIRNYDINF